MCTATPLESVAATPLLVEMTNWRNYNASNLVHIGKRVTAECGYVLVALIGLIEGIARMILAPLAHLFLSESIYKPLYEGVSLNFGTSLIAILAIFYNPFSKNLSLDHLRVTYLPCYS